tara:strand:- start:124 stop:321 length:198 start_codon:yes stop_codon:yes gene_type:complete
MKFFEYLLALFFLSNAILKDFKLELNRYTKSLNQNGIGGAASKKNSLRVWLVLLDKSKAIFERLC